MIVVGSRLDVRYCIAGVSACADFSLLRCLSSAIMSHCDLIRITSCPDACMEKAWTSVSVAVPMNRGKNSCLSRISADKRFPKKMSADPPTLPVTGLLRCGLHGKVTHYFAFSEQNFFLSEFFIKVNATVPPKISIFAL